MINHGVPLLQMHRKGRINWQKVLGKDAEDVGTKT